MLNRFLTDCRGNMALMLAFLVVPIIGAAGLSIDFGRATYTRTSLQSAVDAAALMLARDVRQNPLMAESLMKSRGEQYFAAQFNKRFSNAATVSVVYTDGRTQTDGRSIIKMSARTTVDTTLMNVVGSRTVNIGSDTTVKWGIKKLEVALALDNTGSMGDSNKMRELKTATRQLLDELYQAAKKIGDVKVAIIPFATDVNVGTENVNATWLDWTAWEADSVNRETVCSGKNCWTQPKSRSTWNGCVWDRGSSSASATPYYDALDDAPTTSNIRTLYQPHQATNCPVPMLPLTDILSTGAWSSSDLNNTTNPTSTLAKKVNSMVAAGNTNVTIGTVWGWHALTSQNVLTQATEPANDLEKILILLTDGENTENRWKDSESRMNTRTTRACTNFKDVGNTPPWSVTLYTIRVIDGDATMLKGCASPKAPGSSEKHYYEVKTAAELSSTFRAIAQSLTQLAIAE